MEESTFKFRTAESVNALIYFPDISGFTDFVNQTEITHSQLIVVDLLETIINTFSLPFSISEIEGDAILYYKYGNVPDVGKLVEESKNLFIKYHERLKHIIKNNHCSCGGCSNAYNLSLKFIVHYGIIHQIKVGNFNKLFGRDLIIAHRLLKNSLNKNEYILLTDDYINAVPSNYLSDKADEIIEGTEDLGNLGTLKFKAISLESLRK